MWRQDVYYYSAWLDEHTAEQRHPTQAKSQDIFLEKGGEMKPLESLYYSSGGPQPSPAAERSGHQAKRARVESIKRGMPSSPVGEMRRDLVQRPQVSQKQHLLETQPMWDCSPDTTSRDGRSYREGESISSGRCKTTKLTNFSLEPDKAMADVLKYELSRAVSNSVDNIFRSMPLIQVRQKDSGKSSLGACNEAQVVDVQTEALSLVVQRPQVEGFDHFGSKVHRTTHDVALQEPDKTPNGVHRNTKSGGSKSEPRQAKMAAPRKSDQVGSGSPGSPLTHVTAAEPTLLESVCFPRVEIEPSGLVKRHLYILNEGLTTNHLKKAKLMFFYTRYPSSLVLKMCFRDVQFTRCSASQLIKWFSNFREFYYIQTERFARRAVAEGAADARALSVGRESQLFRALNVHYNKGGDFQVPNAFLEVAETTLREFYTAISTGKDRDPSWKKAIYKVICKLDADVPAQFKTHG